MEVNYNLIKLLGCHNRNSSIVKNSYLYVCVGIMVSLVLKKHVFSIDFLDSLLSQLFKAFVRHVVVRMRLFKCKFSGEHRSVYFKVGMNTVENNFRAFFNKLVIVLQVEEVEHGLVVMSVRCHPVPELFTCVIRSKLIKSSIRNQGNAFAYSSIFCESFENSCSSRHNPVHRKA